MPNTMLEKGFPDTSVGKESACNAGDPGLTSRSGRSTGEGIDYPLQYSWAILGQLAMRTIKCLGEELEKLWLSERQMITEFGHLESQILWLIKMDLYIRHQCIA